MTSKQQIEQAIKNHFDAWNSKDKEAWFANFAEDIVMEDPVGGRPVYFSGRLQVRVVERLRGSRIRGAMGRRRNHRCKE